MAFAAPVDDGTMFSAAARARHGITVWAINEALVARVSVSGHHEALLNPSEVIEHLRGRSERIRCARGARDDAVLLRVISSVFTPNARVTSAPFDGALRRTRFAPASRCFAASVAAVKRPVDFYDDVNVELAPMGAEPVRALQGS